MGEPGFSQRLFQQRGSEIVKGRQGSQYLLQAVGRLLLCPQRLMVSVQMGASALVSQAGSCRAIK